MNDSIVKYPPPSDPFYGKRSIWLDYLSEQHDISHATFRVAYFIARRMNHKTQASWWEIRKIAKQLNCSPTTVIRAIESLEEKSLLTVQRKKGNLPNEYQIRMPYDSV